MVSNRTAHRQRTARAIGQTKAYTSRVGCFTKMEGSCMERIDRSDPPALEAACYKLYREFFDLAERKRRWSIRHDIPWNLCSRSLNPAVADVVESFCAIELYLPDYVANAMSVFRSSRAYLWFYANWGYEESKHSLA